MLPRIEECIQYVKDCGFEYLGYNRPWYRFIRAGKTVCFTLTEIRHAFQYGF
jgi:hypothetical protein